MPLSQGPEGYMGNGTGRVETIVSAPQSQANGTPSNGNGIHGAANGTANGTGTGMDEGAMNMLAVAMTVLQQALDFLNELTSDEQLTFQSTYIPGSTIGKHLRHARDHFILLLDGSSPSTTSPTQPPYEISYDTRLRNTPMERSRSAAVDSIRFAMRRLEEVLPRVGMGDEVRLMAVTPELQTFGTTFGREMWFASLHAVHHWSMIRVIAGEQGITMEDSFGVAPSTLVYHGTQAPLGKAKI